SNDIFQQPGAQSYNRFMAGIGRLSGVEHRESHSGGIRIRDRDYLSEDGDFLTFSYDSETNFLSTEDLPAEVVNRWHRDWYLDIRDISANGGEIELKFDFSEAGLSLNSDEFVLLSRSNTGIDFEILAHSASLSDDQVTFILDVNDLNSQAYYTLGTYQKKAGPGNAFTLDGTNYIDSEYQSTLPTKFSISAWFKLDDLSANQTLIGKGVDDTNEELLLAFLSDGSIFFDTRDFRQQSFANEVETGKWYHIFVSKNGSILNCWLNGRLISWRTGELQSTPSDESQPVLIGNGRNSSLSFEGQIDEVVLWNGDIDDEDIIRSWICKKIDGLHPDYNRILLYYRFDELVQSKALDFSRNANNARLLNTPQMDTSGAALGDESIYDYVAPLDTFLLAAENDSVLVSNITGSPDGVHLYYVNTTPFDTTSNLDLLDVDKYWGVFVAGGSNPTFDLIYNYTGNRQAGDENQNRLARRDDHSQSWQNSGSVPQKLSNRLQLNDNERGEYILGFDRASSSGDGPGAANSLQYDGQDDFTNLGNSLNPGSGDFSWEVWLKVDDFGDESSQQVFSQGLSGTGIPANAGFGLELEDDIANDEFAARFLIRGNGNSLFASTASGLKEGEWYHLAGVRSANNVRIYVNGILRNVAITPSTYDVSSNLDFGMGSFLEAGNESKFFKGKIDEFRFWNQALNVDEIREWLCRKVNPQHPQYQFLIAYHRFDLNSGTFSPDRAGVSNGTLSSTLSSPAQWDISGAALGDSAQVNYSSPTSLTYSSAKSSLSLSNITGGAQGVIIYQSPALPQGSTLPSPITEIDDEFYGVFSSGDITYDVVYDYSDNFSVLSPPTLALPRSLIQLG
ncbi:MAG: LamG domain-containing protein, partial [Bacteroidota bacterium]